MCMADKFPQSLPEFQRIAVWAEHMHERAQWFEGELEALLNLKKVA